MCGLFLCLPRGGAWLKARVYVGKFFKDWSHNFDSEHGLVYGRGTFCACPAPGTNLPDLDPLASVIDPATDSVTIGILVQECGQIRSTKVEEDNSFLKVCLHPGLGAIDEVRALVGEESEKDARKAVQDTFQGTQLAKGGGGGTSRMSLEADRKGVLNATLLDSPYDDGNGLLNACEKCGVTSTQCSMNQREGDITAFSGNHDTALNTASQVLPCYLCERCGTRSRSPSPIRFQQKMGWRGSHSPLKPGSVSPSALKERGPRSADIRAGHSGESLEQFAEKAKREARKACFSHPKNSKKSEASGGEEGTRGEDENVADAVNEDANAAVAAAEQVLDGLEAAKNEAAAEVVELRFRAPPGSERDALPDPATSQPFREKDLAYVACGSPDTPSHIDPARIAQLRAELERERAEPAPWSLASKTGRGLRQIQKMFSPKNVRGRSPAAVEKGPKAKGSPSPGNTKAQKSAGVSPATKPTRTKTAMSKTWSSSAKKYVEVADTNDRELREENIEPADVSPALADLLGQPHIEADSSQSQLYFIGGLPTSQLDPSLTCGDEDKTSPLHRAHARAVTPPTFDRFRGEHSAESGRGPRARRHWKPRGPITEEGNTDLVENGDEGFQPELSSTTSKDVLSSVYGSMGGVEESARSSQSFSMLPWATVEPHRSGDPQDPGRGLRPVGQFVVSWETANGMRDSEQVNHGGSVFSPTDSTEGDHAQAGYSTPLSSKKALQTIPLSIPSLSRSSLSAVNLNAVSPSRSSPGSRRRKVEPEEGAAETTNPPAKEKESAGTTGEGDFKFQLGKLLKKVKVWQ